MSAPGSAELGPRPGRWPEPRGSGSGRRRWRSAAPTDAASALASSASASGATMHSSSSPRAARHDVARHRRPAVRQQHGHPPSGPASGRAASCATCERAGEVGGAEAPQGQEVVDHLRRGLGTVLGLGDDDVLCRRRARCSPRAPGEATAAAATAAVASGRPPIEPLRSTSRHSAVPGLRPAPHAQRARRRALRRGRGPRPAPRGWRRGRGRRRRAGRAGSRMRADAPRAGAAPRGRTSTTSRPARRRASSRSRGSVAPVRSASSARASSGSSASRPRKAASSSWPTSGDICSKRGWRASSRREVVRSGRLGHGLVGGRALLDAGDAAQAGRPPPGRQLFPAVRPRLVAAAEDLAARAR